MDSIVLVGCFGYPNYGDEILLKSWLDVIFKDNNIRVIVECHNPCNAQAILGTYNNRVVYQDSLWRIAWEYKSEYGDPFTFGIRKIKDSLKYRGANRFMLRNVFSAKAIHFIGGGYFRDGWNNHYVVLGEVYAIKKMHSVPVTMSGQGFLPFSESISAEFLSILDSFDFVSVRDRASYEKVQGITSLYKNSFLDDTFMLDESPLIKKDKESQKNLVVCIQNDIMNVNIHNYLLDKIRLFCKTDSYKVCLLEFCPNHDLHVLEKIKLFNDSVRVISFEKIFNGQFTIGPSDVCVGTRYHFHLLSARAGACGIFGSADYYYGIKHDSLLDLGTEWQNVDLYHEILPEFTKPRIEEEKYCKEKKEEVGRIIKLWNI